MGPTPAVAAVRLAVRTALADLTGGDVVLVACSGGADSLALAAALVFEADRLGVRAGGVTVDHGLQDGSADQAVRTVALLRDLGLDPVHAIRAEVGANGGPEGAARAARYAVLDAVAVDEHAAAVLLGHTRDDQAETVLLGLARGSGARSLSGMAPRVGIYRRPLLDLSRGTVAQACADAGLTPWADPHNSDSAYARARVRHTALPVLEETLGPGVTEALARSARLLRDDADALDAIAADAHLACVDSDGGLCVAALTDLPAAVRRRALHRSALAAGCRPTDLHSQHLFALDRLVTSWRGQGPVDLPGGVKATRHNATITFTRPK